MKNVLFVLAGFILGGAIGYLLGSYYSDGGTFLFKTQAKKTCCERKEIERNGEKSTILIPKGCNPNC